MTALRTYLSNASVNRLSIHTALHALAWGMSGNFFIVYLLSHGITPVKLFLYLPIVYSLRFVFRPIVLYAAPRLGSRCTLYIGSFFFAMQYLVLGRVTGADNVLWIYCLLNALSGIFYFVSYHAIFAFSGDDTHRGKQIGAREALATVANIAAPLIGGFSIDHFSPQLTFGMAAIIELIAIFPLLRVPDMPIAKIRPKGAYSAVYQGAFIYMTDGWISVGFVFVWAAMLSSSTGDSFTTFGSALALSGLVSAIGGMFLGKLIDGGKARYAVLLNGALLLMGLVLRAFTGSSLSAMFATAAASSLLGATYIPVLITAVYGLAAKAPCPLRFVFATETAWDVGCVSACLAVSVLLSAGVNIGWVVLLAVPAAIVQMVLLRTCYAKHSIKKV